MTTPLLSPSEGDLSDEFGHEAIVSSIPEEKGADVLLYSKRGLMGMQRKTIPYDFISSFTDGRMARELSLLSQSCTFTRLICEGKFRYWPDGTVDMGMLKGGGGKRVPCRFTRKNIRGMLNDIEFVRGVMIEWTDNIADTVAYVKSVQTFLASEEHHGLFNRPSAKGTWGVPSAKDIQLWLLQSFTGIGPATADDIISRFEGLPLRWTCTFEELCSVPLLRPKRAQEMWEILEGKIAPTGTFGSLREMLHGE